MRKIARLFSVFTILVSATLFAQPKQYVTWSFSQNKLSDTEYELVFKASIEKKWHLYSQIGAPDSIIKKDGSVLKVRVVDDNKDNVTYNKLGDPNGPVYSVSKQSVSSVVYAEGPLPTVFKFEKSGDFKLVEKTTEPKPIEQMEPVFDNMVLRFFEDKAVFKQKIKILSGKPVVVKGYIDGMTCNETQCQKFSPAVDFEFKFEGGAGAAVKNSADTTQLNADTAVVAKDTVAADSIDKQAATPAASASNGNTNKGDLCSPWLAFLIGLGGGLFALITPCVYSMIPLTVSFFTKQSKTKEQGRRNAITYALSIVFIYVCSGMIIVGFFGDDALNRMSTNVWVNLVYFLIFIIFGLSFLGAFEITLPNSWINKTDNASNKGGFFGIFFMAFTLVLVSFSCTGPALGSLLPLIARGSYWCPFMGFLGFGLMIALPFGLLAFFPGWLNSLPKAGGWLNTIKVTFGFIEVALAFKFLSNADLVLQAGLLQREVFIAIWIAVFFALSLYLFGFLKLSHDSDLPYLGTTRLMFAMLSLFFTVYMIPGLWGAPLKLISGFPPPDFYSESPEGFGGQKIITSAQGNELPEHAHRGPNGIPAFEDYYQALEYSKKVNKPVMIDFTGWACVNCRKMEGEVWSDAEVKRKLSEEFILVSLYVDEKRNLPEELQKEVDWAGKMRKLRTIGDKWSHLQSTKYLSATQPQYWIIDSEEKRFSDSASYDPDIKKYTDWLNKGLERYNKEHKK